MRGLVYSIFIVYGCLAVPGDLDTSFGVSRGYTLTSIDTCPITGRCLAVQVDGKFVVVGSYYNPSTEKYSVIVARYTSAGIPDESFGTHGIVHTVFSWSTIAKLVALQPNGKIVVGATYDRGGYTSGIMIIRYKTNGTLDSTFGNRTGYVKTFINPMSEINSMTIGTDEKINVGGWCIVNEKNALLFARYKSSGTLDRLFANAGILKKCIGGYESVLNTFKQKTLSYILAAGSVTKSQNESSLLLKMNYAGVLQKSFAGKGYVIIPISSTQRDVCLWLVLQGSKLLVVGSYLDTTLPISRFKIYLMRLSSAGVLDTSFGTARTGIVKTSCGADSDDYAYVLAVQPNNKIIIAGACVEHWQSSLLLARYQSNGVLDATFGTGGIVKTVLGECWASGIAVVDNKLIVAGASDYGSGVNQLMIARYLLA